MNLPFRNLLVIVLLSFIALELSVEVSAQTSTPEPSPTPTKKPLFGNAKDKEKDAKTKKKDLPTAIADNSFLIEEAYNQEKGVMQTISTCAWFRNPTSDVACSLTQEFPLGGQKHQISYTLPVSWLDRRQNNGIGDLLINYRYQLRSEEHWAAIAPRISLILPTGNRVRNLGSGSPGVQFNFPVSRREGKYFVWHFNAGATFLPSAKFDLPNGNEIKRSLKFYNLGGSAIILAHQRFNIMTEVVENFGNEFEIGGRTRRFNEHIINPGVRIAIDIKKLQIVPGISFPSSFRDGNRRSGVFFYLSFEHPFAKTD